MSHVFKRRNLVRSERNNCFLLQFEQLFFAKCEVKGKGSFYIAQYPVRWTAQSASHFLPSLTDLFNPTPTRSILARQQLRAKTKSLTFPPLSIARYSFIQMSQQLVNGENENAQSSKRYQRGFEPGLTRLRVRHSTTELPTVVQVKFRTTE